MELQGPRHEIHRFPQLPCQSLSPKLAEEQKNSQPRKTSGLQILCREASTARAATLVRHHTTIAVIVMLNVEDPNTSHGRAFRFQTCTLGGLSRVARNDMSGAQSKHVRVRKRLCNSGSVRRSALKVYEAAYLLATTSWTIPEAKTLRQSMSFMAKNNDGRLQQPSILCDPFRNAQETYSTRTKT